ncbi:MAG TPA: hypothetical protein VGU23_08300 [Acidobacteriaceae bacterium]|nr:hypothetical protein [Acidobacteriaceae bacterium]
MRRADDFGTFGHACTFETLEHRRRAGAAQNCAEYSILRKARKNRWRNAPAVCASSLYMSKRHEPVNKPCGGQAAGYLRREVWRPARTAV